MPNGTAYTLTYDPTYALVSKITYPTGGYVRYVWGIGTPTLSMNYENSVAALNCSLEYSVPQIQSRFVSYDGTHEVEEQDFTYSTTFGSNYLWTAKQTTVVTKDLVRNSSTQVVYNYGSALVPSNAPTDLANGINPITIAPVETSVLYYDVNGTLLKTNTQTWYDQYLLQSKQTTLPGVGTSSTGYGTYFLGGAPSEVDEYNFGNPLSSGSPDIKTVTAFQSLGTTPIYLATNSLVVEPQSIKVYGGNTEVSEIDYSYDGAALASVANMPSGTHDEVNYGPTSTVSRGNITSITYQCFQNCASTTTTATYDETGNIVTTTDGCGNASCSDMIGSSHTTNYSYTDSYSSGSPSGNTNSYLTKVTDSLGHPQSFSYSYNDGQLTRATDANKKTVSYTYNTPPSSCATPDGLDRLSTINYPDGGQTTYCYNDTVPSITTSQLLNTSGVWKVATSVMDGMGHVIHSAVTSDPAGTETVDTTYDGMGRVYSVSNPYRSTADPTYGLTKYTYDAIGRKILQVQSDGISTLQWCYDGVISNKSQSSSNSQSICSPNASANAKINTSWVDSVDENGGHWQHVSDGFGRLVAAMEPDPTTNTPTMETDYSYDALNNLLGVNQKGKSNTESPRIRSFNYDSLSRLVAACNPEGLAGNSTCTAGSSGPWSTTYSYDANGNVSSKTSGLGTVSYCYEPLNRLTGKSYSGVTCPSIPDVSYTYDTSTVANAANTIGRLTSESTLNSGSVVSTRTPYLYDAMGRLQGLQECVFPNCGSAPYEIDYTYDFAGDTLTSTNGLPAATASATQPYVQLTMGYDGAARLSSVASSWSDATTHPRTILQANSTSSTSPAYSPAGALMNASFGINPLSTQTTGTLTRTYDDRLRITSENDTVGNALIHAATTASGSISIVGSEAQATSSGTPGTGTITVTGTEGSHTVCTTTYKYNGPGKPEIPVITCNSIPDTGSLVVTVNASSTFTATAMYGSGSTDPTVAAAIATALDASGSPVTETSNGNVITLTSVATGTASNYAYSVTNGADFSGADSGLTLSGGGPGGPVYDTGTISISVNGGTTVTATWQSGSTTGSLASVLASALSNSANGYTTLFTATQNSTGVTLTSLQAGSAGNLAISCSEAHTSSQFSSASFTTSCGGMSGGANAQYAAATAYSYLIANSSGVPGSGYAANGNVNNVTDSVTGAWTYSYDYLNRLTQAVGVSGSYVVTPVVGATLGWSYDSFGNRLGQSSTSANFPTTWQCYAGSTNPSATCSGVANNRMISSSAAVGGYGYDAAGDITGDGEYVSL